jgi:hypothetical protein
MDDKNLSKYVTTSEAAEYLQITTGALRSALQKKTVKGIKVDPHTWLVDLGDMKPGDRKVGRPFNRAKRCPCGKSTLKRAKARRFDCCRTAGVAIWVDGRRTGQRARLKLLKAVKK